MIITPSSYYINVATASTPYATYGLYHSTIELGDVSKKEAIEKFRWYKALLPKEFNLTLHYITCYSSEIEWIEKKSDDDIGYDF